MLSTTSRRYVVATTIGSFSVAALMGIAALLGGDFGATQGRVLLTTLAVGLASLAVLCFVTTSETRYESVGATGCLVVLVPLASALLLIWGEDAFDDSGEALWKLLGVGAVVAGTLAQACLLLAFVPDAAWPRRLRDATLAMATLLALVLCGLVLSEGDGGDGVLRLVGVLAILDVLGTVLAGLAALVGRGAAPAPTAPRAPTGPVAPGTSGSGQLVALPGALADRLEGYAVRTGRRPADVVAAAVEAHLDGLDGLDGPGAQSGT